jgi:hypothetical protein
MFSDFKSRGFGVEDTQIRYVDRLDLCCSSWPWLSTGRCPAACGMPFIIRLQAKKKLSRSPQKG